MAGDQKHVLIVTTVELGGGAIEQLVGDDAITMVVVPAVKQSRLQWLANDEDRARDVARRAAERLAGDTPGTTVAAEVGDSDPLMAIEDALRRADTALYEAKSLGRNRCVANERGSVAGDDVRRPA